MKNFFTRTSRTFLTLGIIFSCSLISQFAHAQGTWAMAEPTNGTGPGVDKANGICTDASGNVYMIGQFGSTGSPTVDFDLTTGGTQNGTTHGSTQSDGFIASYTSTGTFRWVVIVGGSSATAENGQP